MSARRRTFAATAAAVAAAAALSAVLVPHFLFADSPVPFPGREIGARQAADEGLAQRVNVATTNSGLTLKITGFIADETQTLVSYVLTGREAEGDGEFGVEPPTLIDSSGNAYRASSGSVDQADFRRGTWVFPPIPAKAGTLSVVVNGFQLASRSTGNPPKVTTVPGTWKIEFAWDGSKPPAGPSVNLPDGPQPFGPGSISIDSVEQTATGTVVNGSLEGFTVDAIQWMHCPAGGLETVDGTSVGEITCRSGFGDNYRLFTVTYPPTFGRVKLNFELDFNQNGPPGVTLPAQFESAQGAQAAFELDLPAR